jgi:co-chaperonin GroES (HSP10)
MKVIALNDSVIVEPLEEDNVTAGGIIIEQDKKVPIKGRVLSVGPEMGDTPIEIGDVVLFFIGHGIALDRNYPGVRVKKDELLAVLK